MIKLIVFSFIAIYMIFILVYIIRLLLKHNIFINYLKISAKFIGLDIEIKTKQKDAPSEQD